MQTKLITNSVTKWVERATCKVKLIIKWIKIEEENNEEVTE